MGKFLSWKVKWMRVWNFCSPFIFCNIVCWFWLWYFFPAKSNIDQIHNNRNARQCSKITTLNAQNRELRKRYSGLYSQAREKLHFVHGQKMELERQLREWQARAVDLEIKITGAKINLTDYKTRKALFAPTLQDERSGVELKVSQIPLEPENDRQDPKK